MQSLLTGFNRAAAAEREAVRTDQRRRDQQELAILEALAKADDPEIASLAVAGLLDFAAPRKKKGGLGGFLGETEAHPALPAIRHFLQVPVQKAVPTPEYRLNVTQGLPMGGEIRQTPAPVGAAAQPATTPVTGGPMGMPAPVQGLPTLAPPTAPPVSRTLTGPPQMTQVPRRAFLSQTEQTLQMARARAQGDVEGEVAGLIAAGYSEEQARELVKQTYLRRTTGGVGATGFQAVDVELPDGTQRKAVFDRARGVYIDPDTGQPFLGARPRSRTGSTSLGSDRESLALEMYGRRAVQLSPEEMATVNDALIARAGETSYSRGVGAGEVRADTALLMPLTADEASLQEVKVGTTWADLQGIVPITTDQHGRLLAARNLAPQIDVIGNLVMDVFPSATGLTGGLTASAVLKQKEIARDPKLARLKAAVSLALGNVARVIAAESGRLTEQDAQRARDALVNLNSAILSGDTQESAVAKLIDLRAATQRIISDIKTPGQVLQERQGPGATPPPPALPASSRVPGVAPRSEAATGAPPAPPAVPSSAAPSGGARPAPQPSAPAPGATPPPPSLQGVYKPGDRVQLQDGRQGQVMRVLPDGQLGVCPIDPTTGQISAACAAKYGAR